MDVIGASLLSDHGARHPPALPFLRGLYALITRANWTERACVERDCRAIARFENDGAVILESAQARCRVALGIHYRLGVVRIMAVTETGEVETDDQQCDTPGETDQNTG